MIIEFELKGAQMLHKGIFETTGFWVKYGEEEDDETGVISSYKLWSHFSFTYETNNKEDFKKVYGALQLALMGSSQMIQDIGYIRILQR